MPSVNSKALDLRSVKVTPTGHDFTVQLKVADLSDAALQQALQDNAPASSLVWIFRWVNGYQPVAVSMHWNPAEGFRAGFDTYLTDRTAGGTIQKYPGSVSLADRTTVSQTAGTLTFRVPGSLLKGLTGPQGDGQRPREEKAVPGTRFYDGFAGSFADVTTSVSTGGSTTTESYLYPADNAPTFDFTLLRRTATPVSSHVLEAASYAAPVTTSGSGSLAVTGLESSLPWLATGLLVLGGALLRQRRRAA
jgi:hypothetical protein